MSVNTDILSHTPSATDELKEKIDLCSQCKEHVHVLRSKVEPIQGQFAKLRDLCGECDLHNCCRKRPSSASIHSQAIFFTSCIALSYMLISSANITEWRSKASAVTSGNWHFWAYPGRGWSNACSVSSLTKSLVFQHRFEKAICETVCLIDFGMMPPFAIAPRRPWKLKRSS